MKAAALCLLLLLSLPAPAVAGGAGIYDGNSIGLGKNRMRLWGIDAPGLEQICQRPDGPYPCGIEARDWLRQLVASGAVECRETNRNKEGRKVARCTVNGTDVGSLMVRSGWAVDYETYSHGAYAAEQAEAKAAKRGLWAGDFELPAEWRRKR